VILGGGGEVVDWVVRMARVPKPDFFDAVAKSGGLSPELLDQLADTVAAMHQRLRPAARDAEAALRGAMMGNHASGLAAGLPKDRVNLWRDGMTRAIDRCAAWLTQRGRDGFIRRTHGDLHLSNLCLWQGRPVAFDALEFSEAMATIDLGYDLAFLLMDLEIRAGRPAANRVFNRYLARTGDVGLVTGLPMFLSMRAFVRAHVTANGGGDFHAYLDYAEAALAPAPSVVLGIGGLPGSGKSTLARTLAPGLGRAPGAVVLRSDEGRKRLFGVAPEERLPREAYRADVSRQVKSEIFAGIRSAAGAGHAVIADMTFMDPADRLTAEDAAGATPFLGFWLQASLPELEKRVANRLGDASDADLAVLRKAAASDPGAGRWVALESADPALVEKAHSHVTIVTGTC
jgi:predicted kinase